MKATITLTDAQIKHVDTPHIIVPATETLDYDGAPTQIPVPVACFICANTAAGNYTNINGNATFRLVWGSDWSADLMTNPAGGLGSAGAAKSTFAMSGSLLTQLAVTPAEDVEHRHSLDGVSLFNLDGNLQDNAPAFVINNSDGDLTGGNVDNSLKVTVLYDIIDL